jgi:hypothetical protein
MVYEGGTMKDMENEKHTLQNMVYDRITMKKHGKWETHTVEHGTWMSCIGIWEMNTVEHRIWMSCTEKYRTWYMRELHWKNRQ